MFVSAAWKGTDMASLTSSLTGLSSTWDRVFLVFVENRKQSNGLSFSIDTSVRVRGHGSSLFHETDTVYVGVLGCTRDDRTQNLRKDINESNDRGTKKITITTKYLSAGLPISKRKSRGKGREIRWSQRLRISILL
jgi:hypothetical protein